jgi:dCMP deaminase
MQEFHVRPSVDEIFLELARVIGKRGTCDRGRAGAVIVLDKRLLASGYVGAPSGLPHCDEVGHEMVTNTDSSGKVSQHCIRTAHAEMNAICNAARFGVAINGATLYCKFEPCYMCAKAIINSGIKRVVCERRYHAAERSRFLFNQVGIELVVMTDELQEYPNQT